MSRNWNFQVTTYGLCAASGSAVSQERAYHSHAAVPHSTPVASADTASAGSSPAGSQAPAFSGERYKGDNRYYNDARPCDEAQYAAYLEKADPGTVAMAYPTAAGKAKTSKAKKPAAGASAPAKSK